MPENLLIGFAALPACLDRVHQRDPYEKEERREDEISRCPTVPLGVHDGPIGMLVAPGVVHDNHARHHQAAIDVEAKQAPGESDRAVELEILGWLNVAFRRCHAATIFRSPAEGHSEVGAAEVLVTGNWS